MRHSLFYKSPGGYYDAWIFIHRNNSLHQTRNRSVTDTQEGNQISAVWEKKNLLSREESPSLWGMNNAKRVRGQKPASEEVKRKLCSGKVVRSLQRMGIGYGSLWVNADQRSRKTFTNVQHKIQLKRLPLVRCFNWLQSIWSYGFQRGYYVYSLCLTLPEWRCIGN
jgi:hypothetical protein